MVSALVLNLFGPPERKEARFIHNWMRIRLWDTLHIKLGVIMDVWHGIAGQTYDISKKPVKMGVLHINDMPKVFGRSTGFV